MFSRVFFIFVLLLVGACSSSGSSSGNAEPGADCQTGGYPCSPADVSPEARELSHQYVDAVRERLDAGESFEDVTAWLQSQEDIADAVGDAVALRFRVEGGSALWFYDPPAGIARPVPSEAPQETATAAMPVGLKAVVREDDDEDNIKKRALLIEPFEQFIATPTARWIDELDELHDYERVDHVVNQSVSDEYFGNWDDYRFVWVTTHGKHLPTRAPTYSALYSSRMCEEFGWLKEEIEAGRGDELTRGGATTLRALFGYPRGYVKESLTAEQAARLEAYEIAETPEQDGIHCGNLTMDWIYIPGAEPGDSALTDVTVKYWYYDETWFQRQFPGGLQNAVVYQRACTSDLLPLQVASGSRGAILGWSDTINSADDDKTIGVLFDHLIAKGETLQDALEEVSDAGFHRFSRGDKNPTLEIVSEGRGTRDIRVREIVSVVDPDVLVPFPDEGAVLEAREITADGRTLVDVTVLIEGFGDRMGEEFEVQFFDGTGNAISDEWEVDEPTNGTTVMTLPISLDQEIRTPTEVDIEARVTLPEDAGALDSRHAITATINPAVESLWTLNVGGLGTLRGDFVHAPTAMAISDGERLLWDIVLGQLGDSIVPMANLILVGHPGRTPECTGQTGIFDGLVGITHTTSPMPTEFYGGGLGEGECGDFVDVEIVSFSREEDLVANVSGTICHAREVGEETVITPVPINGSFQMPSAGCGADPGADLIGSYYAVDAPPACFDIYPNAQVAPAFDELCMQTGLICSEDPCATEGQIGQCDYRSSAVPLTYRGQVQHIYPGEDWPPIGDLQAACELNLGVWTTGEPMMP